MMLSQLFLNLHIPSHVDRVVTGLSLDSRAVKSGDVFIACQGTHLDGKAYINDALEKGAQTILIEGEKPGCSLQNTILIITVPNLRESIGDFANRFYGDPQKKLKIIGITGTNGKTSCSHFIAQALAHYNIKCGIIGTLGSGFYGKIQPGSLTTPDPITLHALFNEFVKQNAKMVAMEVSSHSIDQRRIQGINFEVGIFTNLTRDHLDYHGTMEAYGAAKRKLFDNPLTKQVVINADDPFGKDLLNTLNRKHLYAYSRDYSGESFPFVSTENLQLTAKGMTAKVKTPWGEGELTTSLIGQFNLSNLLAVLTTLCLLDVPFAAALESMGQLSSVPGRMQRLGGENKPLVIVDYAHTPDALEKVLGALRAHCEGKLLCLFGCGGDRDRGKRPLMATIAEHYADTIIVTDDNPRAENPKKIVNDIMQGFTYPNKIRVQHDRAEAIKEILQMAQPGDCVLIAGKGAELYQQIGEEKLPFSDIEKVSYILHAKSDHPRLY